ncbi:MAG TPA: hypothetical protein DEQ14_04270 [Treponema sp.]|nr:hypothetical protein [Treponema sp.]
MTLQQIFITNLKKIRKEQGMSQMVLSEKCDTSSNYIGQIEMGRRIPSFDKIEKIAAALDILPHELFAYESEGKKEEKKRSTKDFIREMPVGVKKELIANLTALIKKAIDASFNV